MAEVPVNTVPLAESLFTVVSRVAIPLLSYQIPGPSDCRFVTKSIRSPYGRCRMGAIMGRILSHRAPLLWRCRHPPRAQRDACISWGLTSQIDNDIRNFTIETRCLAE